MMRSRRPWRGRSRRTGRSTTVPSPCGSRFTSCGSTGTARSRARGAGHRLRSSTMTTGRRTTAPPARPAGRSTRTGGDRGSSGEGRMGVLRRAASCVISRGGAALIAAAAIGIGAGDLRGAGVYGGAAVRASPASPLRAQGEVSPFREYRVPPGSHPHDVAPAPDGTVWYTAQTAGELGRLDPATGRIRRVKLGEGSAPQGGIVGPDGAPWVTDGGLNAIVRVAPRTGEIRRFPLPAARDAA